MCVVERITFSCPDETAEELNGQMDGYGDNRSAFIVNAIEEKLERIEAEA